MPKAAPILNNFNAGELTPLLEGRPNVDSYANGLRLCENWVPLVQGPLAARPGTKFVWPVKDSTKTTRLVRFEFSTTQAYILEFGDQYIRFHKDHAVITQTAQDITGITKANPAVVTYSGADTYANGDRIAINSVAGMVEVNNREFTVANVNAAANTFELSGIDSTSYTTYTSGGTAAEIYEISSPYLEADLFDIKFAQSADTLYIVASGYAPRKLTRSAHTTWTLTTITFEDGPYLPVNDTTTTLTPSAVSGAGITITASASTFAATDVGRLVRIRHRPPLWQASTAYAVDDVVRKGTRTYVCITAGTSAASGGPTGTGDTITDGTVIWDHTSEILYQWGNAVITQYNSATEVVATVNKSFGDITAIVDWRLGVWSATTGYPVAVTFFQDRLFFGGPSSYPQRIDGSCVGDYEHFKPSDIDGTVASDNSLGFTLNSNDVNVIQWMEDDEKGLIVGTVGGEWIVRPSTAGEALTPENVQATRSTKFGSNSAPPQRVGKALLFASRNSRKLRELAYVFEDDGFRAPDMTLRSEHITLGGIDDLTYTAQPQPIVWAVRGDGVLLGFTYEREQEVLGWHRHVLGGVFGSGDSVVESIAAIPSPDATADELWLVVKRTVNGATKRYIEYLTPFWDDSMAQEDAFFVDCGATYDGASTTTVSGLFHLEGQTVTILADGATHPTKTVASGKITLDRAATVVQIGLGYTSDAWTERLEAGAADGTAQGKSKRIRKATFRFWQTLGIQVGKDEDNLDPITFRQVGDDLTAAVPLFSGDKAYSWEAGSDTDGGVYIQRYQPFPATLLAIMPRVVTQDG
jgi:hypothetical protein